MKNSNVIKTICYFVGCMLYSFAQFIFTIKSPFQLKVVRFCDWLHKSANGKDGFYYKAYCLFYNIFLTNGFYAIHTYNMKIIKISDKLKGWEYGVGYTNKPSFLSN